MRYVENWAWKTSMYSRARHSCNRSMHTDVATYNLWIAKSLEHNSRIYRDLSCTCDGICQFFYAYALATNFVYDAQNTSKRGFQKLIVLRAYAKQTCGHVCPFLLSVSHNILAAGYCQSEKYTGLVRLLDPLAA